MNTHFYLRSSSLMRVLIFALSIFLVSPVFASSLPAPGAYQSSMDRPGGSSDRGHGYNGRHGNSYDRPGGNVKPANDKNRREAEKLMRKAEEYRRKADKYNFEARQALSRSEEYRRDAVHFADLRDYRRADEADRMARKEMDRYNQLSQRAHEASRKAAEYRERASYMLRR